MSNLQDLIQNWRNAADANHRAACKHADCYGTGNQTYVELMERARALRDCAEHLGAVLEHKGWPWSTWTCGACDFSGVNLLPGEAVAKHHDWNKSKGFMCPGNLVKEESPSGPELRDMQAMSHGQKVEPAIDFLGAWLVRGRYRTLTHHHAGFYKATDESAGEQWSAASIVDLAAMMGDRGLR